jgi:hypothetical protein
MSYLLELMQHLYRLERDISAIDNFRLDHKREVHSQNLTREILNSTRRLQRIKAGIRLDKVIEE